ncbi:MAG: hypothetical protein ABI193_12780, partial [Minicystis sp.]
MIGINRPRTEPAALRRQRRAGLATALAALNQHGIGSKELNVALNAYDGGKETLFLAQYRKCAYCERRTGMTAEPIEHVRPKKEAWRHLPQERPRVVEPGYWWLTWTWENHLFACQSCNTGFKQNYFPLAPGSRRLTGPVPPYRARRLRPEHLDGSVEKPWLIDPSSVNPLDHIEWRPVDPKQPKRRWIWSPAALTKEGEVTIKVLHLHELADDVADHLRDNVIARAEIICAHIDAGRQPQAL